MSLYEGMDFSHTESNDDIYTLTNSNLTTGAGNNLFVNSIGKSSDDWQEHYDGDGFDDWDDLTGSSWDHELKNPQYRDDLIETFDDAHYRTNNPDVDSAINQGIFRSAFDHFVLYGGVEGRTPNSVFDESYYLNANSDVANAVNQGVFNSGYEHFVIAGAREGRDCSSQFNSDIYLTQNPDVAQAIQSGAFDSGYKHYVMYGQFEGRTAF
ncbi:MAG: hypothetical protein WBV73_11885 [Phormidium sp.]